jgi:hypothetical protein
MKKLHNKYTKKRSKYRKSRKKRTRRKTRKRRVNSRKSRKKGGMRRDPLSDDDLLIFWSDSSNFLSKITMKNIHGTVINVMANLDETYAGGLVGQTAGLLGIESMSLDSSVSESDYIEWKQLQQLSLSRNSQVIDLSATEVPGFISKCHYDDDKILIHYEDQVPTDSSKRALPRGRFNTEEKIYCRNNFTEDTTAHVNLSMKLGLGAINLERDLYWLSKGCKLWLPNNSSCATEHIATISDKTKIELLAVTKFNIGTPKPDFRERNKNLRFLISVSEKDVDFESEVSRADKEKCLYPHVSPIIGISDKEYTEKFLYRGAQITNIEDTSETDKAELDVPLVQGEPYSPVLARPVTPRLTNTEVSSTGTEGGKLSTE